MCGRFTLIADPSTIQARFRIIMDRGYQPHYNIAPTHGVLTVGIHRGERTGEVMRWGLVPSWAKDPSVGYRMINARAETVGEKPSFRQALLKRRCLVPADGFFEWRGAGKMRVPLRFTLKSGELFAFAGLWEGWRQPDGEWLHTCTIITTAPNDLVTRIHDRMPVILRRDAEDVWLDPKMIDVALLRGMLVPYPTAEMEARQVSTLVNSPQNDSPECIEPVLAA